MANPQENNKLVIFKTWLEIGAICLAVVIFGFTAYDFSQSVTQRKIENQLSIVEAFSPSLSYSEVSFFVNFVGLPSVRMTLQNETSLPIDWISLGGNYYDCAGNRIAEALAPENETYEKIVSKFWPNSSLIISADTNPIENNLPSRFLIHDPEPFVVEFVWSASMANVAQFREFIENWNMDTTIRDGVGDRDNEAPFSWVYSVRSAFQSNKFILIAADGSLQTTETEFVEFSSYTGRDCTFANQNEIDIVTN